MGSSGDKSGEAGAFTAAGREVRPDGIKAVIRPESQGIGMASAEALIPVPEAHRHRPVAEGMGEDRGTALIARIT